MTGNILTRTTTAILSGEYIVELRTYEDNSHEIVSVSAGTETDPGYIAARSLLWRTMSAPYEGEPHTWLYLGSQGGDNLRLMGQLGDIANAYIIPRQSKTVEMPTDDWTEFAIKLSSRHPLLPTLVDKCIAGSAYMAAITWKYEPTDQMLFGVSRSATVTQQYMNSNQMLRSCHVINYGMDVGFASVDVNEVLAAFSRASAL